MTKRQQKMWTAWAKDRLTMHAVSFVTKYIQIKNDYNSITLKKGLLYEVCHMCMQ